MKGFWKALFSERSVVLDLWFFFICFVVAYVSAVSKVGAEGDIMMFIWFIALLVFDLAYIISVALDEKYRKQAKLIHHLVTMAIGVVIFIKIIMALCHNQEVWPGFMQWGIGANTVMAIYLVMRFIRGFYRHQQNKPKNREQGTEK